MLRVQSLTLRIVLQFAVILLPLLALLIYQGAQGANRAQSMRSAGVEVNAATAIQADLDRVHSLLEQSRNAASFTGLIDPLLQRAMDRLNSTGVEFSAAAPRALQALPARLADTLKGDHSATQLAHARELAAQASASAELLVQSTQRRLHNVVDEAVAASAIANEQLLVLSILMSVMTLMFIAQTLRDLSQPLKTAVDVADRIAAGQQLDQIDVDPKKDLGNLLSSLKRMHQSLMRFETDVANERTKLQFKVVELADSARGLADAQQSAKLGNWIWRKGDDAPFFSDQMYANWDLRDTTHPPSLRGLLRRLSPHARHEFLLHLGELRAQATTVDFEHPLSDLTGNERRLHHRWTSEFEAAGTLLRASGTTQDVTESYRAAEEIRRLAMYDSLTGLANRPFFNLQLNRALTMAKRNRKGLATMFVDLDRFKRINDTLGHSVGDALLREAAKRLNDSVRAGDTIALSSIDLPGIVARLGGDEFTVLLTDIEDARDVATVAGRMLTALATPFEVDGHELVVTASIGIAMYPTDSDNAEGLLNAADTAMYTAKDMGRNSFQFYSADMNAAALERLSLERDLRVAVEKEQFVLHYQPKVDIADGRIAGLEALIRWQHPTHGLIAPLRFIPLAEEIGLIVPISDWVISEVCRQAQAWNEAKVPHTSIAINLASPSFRKSTLVSDLEALIKRHQLEPRQLQIEATEGMLMEHSELTLRTLGELNQLGIKLAIDDFGTGYSSLAYLRRFPFDQLKIDRSFVNDITSSSDAAAITATIISLAHGLKREVVAEGVVTIAQAKLLAEQGCRLMQGFLFSAPLPAAEIAELLLSDKPFHWAASPQLEPVH